MPRPPAQSFRIRPETEQQITEVAAKRGGLPKIRVIELAVSELHAREFSSRPSRRRPAGRKNPE